VPAFRVKLGANDLTHSLTTEKFFCRAELLLALLPLPLLSVSHYLLLLLSESDHLQLHSVPEHALFKEHTAATVTEVLLQPDRICGTACHLTLQLSDIGYNDFKRQLKTDRLQQSTL